MRLKSALLLFGLAAGGWAFADTIYDCTAPTFFGSSAFPSRALDDGSFPIGTVAAAGGSVTVNAVDFGMQIYGSGVADVTANVLFYSDLPLNEEPGTGNPKYLGGFSITYDDIPVGTYRTGLIDIAAIGGIQFFKDSWAVEIVFTDPVTGNPSNRATVRFSGGPVAVGSNQDQYWRDVNGNGIYDGATESLFFGGGSKRAQFVLKLDTSATTTFNGTVRLTDWLGGQNLLAQLPVAVTIDGGAATSFTLTATAPDEGTFSTVVPGSGTHTVRVKPLGFLSQSSTFSSGGSTISRSFDCASGDTDDDNRVDDVDMINLILDFGGPGNQNGQTDTNGDGVCDDYDLLNVILAFGQTGS